MRLVQSGQRPLVCAHRARGLHGGPFTIQKRQRCFYADRVEINGCDKYASEDVEMLSKARPKYRKVCSVCFSWLSDNGSCKSSEGEW